MYSNLHKPKLISTGSGDGGNRDRQTDRQRQRHRETERETETERQRQRETERERDGRGGIGNSHYCYYAHYYFYQHYYLYHNYVQSINEAMFHFMYVHTKVMLDLLSTYRHIIPPSTAESALEDIVKHHSKTPIRLPPPPPPPPSLLASFSFVQ